MNARILKLCGNSIACGMIEFLGKKTRVSPSIAFTRLQIAIEKKILC